MYSWDIHALYWVLDAFFFFVFLQLSFCFALFEVELSSFDGSGSWVITDNCLWKENLSIIENDAHNIVNTSHCLFASLLGVGVPNQGAGDNISVSNPFDDVAPGQSQRPNSYGPPYGHSGGPPRPQGTSLLVCLLTPLVHISCHFNCSHVHFWVVFLVFNTLICNKLLVLCLCWLVWSIFIGCVCGRGPVVVSDLCDPVR